MAMTVTQQIEQRGRIEGVSLMLIKQLKRRFGEISPDLEKKLQSSDFEILDKFGEFIFDFKDVSEAEQWWNARQLPRPEGRSL